MGIRQHRLVRHQADATQQVDLTAASRLRGAIQL
jgi:hypothetical protein